MSMSSSYQARQEDSSVRPRGEPLESWKEIASYLRRTVRTVQRWSQYEGLPVRYHYHRKAKTVYAFKNEIDLWRISRRPKLHYPAASRIGRSDDKNFLSVSVPSLQIICPSLLVSPFQSSFIDDYDHPLEDSPP